MILLLPDMSVSAAPAANFIYTVQPGDNLQKIADRFGVTLDTLVTANNISDPNSIRVGQELVVPVDLFSDQDNLAAEQEPVAVTSERTTSYAVRSGDNLYRIATRYNIEIDAIRIANDLSTDTIFIGQLLTIPVAKSVETVDHDYSGAIFGPPEYIAALDEVLDWLAANDAEAFARLQQYVYSIQPSGVGNRAWARLLGSTCSIEIPVASLQLTASIIYHEASHCQQWFTVGIVDEAASETYAYGEQLAFMRRQKFNPLLVHFYELIYVGFAAQ